MVPFNPLPTLLGLLILVGSGVLYSQEALPDEGLNLGTLPKFGQAPATADETLDSADSEAQAQAIAELKERLKQQASLETFEKAHWLISIPPTRLGYSVRLHEPRADRAGELFHGVAFDTNVGISWLWSNKAEISTARTLAWGANLFYSGSYDFRMDLHSGPILSRVQNPQVSFFLETLGTRGSVTSNWTLGWAHESNGQYASQPGDFALLAAIDPAYNDQFFASMGWDYYFVRYTQFVRWQALSLMPHIELRHIMRQSQGNPLNIYNLEDRANITGLKIRGTGIRAYDGLRLGTLWTTGGGYHVTTDVILPSVWVLNKDYRFLEQTGLEAVVYFDKPITWYVSGKWGTRADPAYYFAHEMVLGAGIAIQSIDFWPK